MLIELLGETVAVLAYGILGILLLALGVAVLDWLTPGRIAHLVWEKRNRNAALLVASNVVGLGIVVTAAIWASEGSLLDGLLQTVVYGLVGIVLMTGAFLLLDLLTPGRLGLLLVDEKPHPAAWVSAALHVVIGAVVALAVM
ncbi:DUF350 domain-containing protein [Myceligenerans crystallogenes]|uniref:DUF350 domain-containing protein n=1 Tax=Myceligenerans crystallogenes TaxID=316335 RepID=A0ABN2NJQ4_9MICO